MKELIKELLNQALEPSRLEGLGGSYMEVKFVINRRSAKVYRELFPGE